MNISIKGGTASQQKHVKSIVKFCAELLMPRITNLDIHIKLTQLQDAYGYCLSNDYDCPSRPRQFELEIHKGRRLRRLLETVCHEMVHVKQYARGELYESTIQNKHRWQGKWLAKDPEYWDRPWEIEAHGRECGLFIRWAEANDLGGYAWTHDE